MEMIAYIEMVYGEVDIFEEIPANSIIVSVDGRGVIGRCKGCGKVIFEDEAGFTEDEEQQIYMCALCMKEREMEKKEET